ncbi:opacity protein-like surface antigen [Sinobacterium caligoides]|uniref:Opacity protein-like surface antigen n=1 Tax=Sinobacterium caligoides TaxID=933926 RepID=A0A3N2DPG8_9GAMM|nr:outer membrane beta-barrel protein [Sinobacterium caligoides]ROS01714.1 opacity protein-like surface antigen [Sinobacterium caligoides]
MKKAALLLALPLLSSIAGNALAADKSGFYAGAGIGHGKMTLKTDGGDLDSNNTRVNIHGGYRFNNYIGTEIAYEDIGEFHQSNGSYTAQLLSRNLSAAAVGYLPLSNRFELYGKAGLALVQNTTKGEYKGEPDYRDTSEDVAVFAALGSNFALTQQVDLFAEARFMYAEPEDQLKAYDTSMTVGARYRF